MLALLWTGLTNGSAIVFCPPVCKDAYPLTDLAHVGAVISGPLAGLAAVWGAVIQWRTRVKVAWLLPVGALVLAIGTVIALANSPVP